MSLPPRTPGARLLPLLALIVFVSLASVSSAGTKPKKKPGQLAYSVTLTIKAPDKIDFHSGSTLDGGSGCFFTTTEDDDFHAETAYGGLKIARTGSGPNNVNLTAQSTTTPGGLDNWTVRGRSTGCRPNSSYDCHGSLKIDPKHPPQMLSTPGTTSKSLHVAIELAKGVLFEDASGDFQPFGCGQQFDNRPALQPASSNGYMPDMLAARADLPLDRMRGLKSGEQFTLDVALDPSYAPPEDCSGGDTTCSERLTWKGEVTVRRD